MDGVINKFMMSSLAILDFGSQYTQLIARRVRELSVYCEIFPWDAQREKIEQIDPCGFILSGSQHSVYEPDAPQVPDFILNSGLPILGICYGMQTLAYKLGGKVASSGEKEYGFANIEVIEDCRLLAKGTQQVWMSHGDRLENLPSGFISLAKSDNSPYAAMGDEARKIYGVQFHPEVRHTPRGKELLRRFVLEICEAKADWTPESIISASIKQIQTKVGNARVLSAVSGGVDSSVATALVHKAIGDQLSAVFVDTGLLRMNERQQVEEAFTTSQNMQLHTMDARSIYLEALRGIAEPEQKRKIIGETFIRLFENKAYELGNPPYLVQGTIYPDVVESSAPDRSKGDTIKTHHNVGGLPKDIQFSLVEPLRYLFKDEVRRVGEALGLPHDLVWRQPFPGPGLAVRCLGEITAERVDRLRQADAIFTSELSHENLLVVDEENGQGSAQAFAVLLPVKSVGVMGDQRTYQETIVLRAVTTDDFMTAGWARLPYDVLARVSNRIVNEVRGINRVVYDITTKPPATIEWE
jgi:GMP synthase (glutamine-hydrolysing)